MADKKISALTASSTPLAGTEVLPIVQSGSTVKVSVSDLTAGRVVSASGAAVNATFKAWSVVNAYQVGTGASFGGGVGFADGFATCNSYYDGAAWRRIVAAGASQIALTPSTGLRFNIASSGAADSTMTWTEVGSFSALTDFTVNTGNLVVGTAGKGINFSANANAPGMTSELLNWYEEGTFTPTFTGLTVGNGSVFGHYRRIGKQVFLTYGFILGSTSAVAALTGVSGFPFTTGTVGASRFFPVTGVAFEGGVGWYGASSAIFSASTSGMGIFSPTNDVGFSATVPFTWGTDDSLSLSATYFVD